RNRHNRFGRFLIHQILKQITTCLIQYHIKKSPKSIDITAILFILPYIYQALFLKNLLKLLQLQLYSQ
ncbi:hypothetical protein, partial [Streptococcus pneumoniae]|uniref:hypothetical protein n=1 Tax=Streptococcus pneumoniae TaxID=1313 RepID=UPI001C9C8E0F